MYALAGGPAVAALTAAALVLLPGVAAADVTVAASRAESGARDVTITFRVTNDDPAVATTGLQVFLPTARPLLGVAPVAPTGWTARVGTAAPTTPVTVDGAPVPEIATSVAWEGGTLHGRRVRGVPRRRGPAARRRRTAALPRDPDLRRRQLPSSGPTSSRTALRRRSIPRWWCRTATHPPPRKPRSQGTTTAPRPSPSPPRRGRRGGRSGSASASVRWSRRGRPCWDAGSGGASPR